MSEGEHPKVKEAKKLDRKLKRIFQQVQETFTPELDQVLQKFEDLSEKDLESQLVLLLQLLFKTYETEYHVLTRSGYVDVVVDDKIAIELKVATVPNLQRLIGQAMMYVRDFPRVGIVVIDLGKVEADILQEYLELLNGISNVNAICVVPKA